MTLVVVVGFFTLGVLLGSLLFAKELEKCREELEAGKKRWAYFESRFIECNSCSEEKKNNCILHTGKVCKGERCTELVDVEQLLEKACDMEELQAAD